MSVIVEFTIESEDFSLGQALSGVSRSMHIELERIVPAGDLMPYIWVTGDDHDAFRKTLRATPVIQAIHELDRIGESRLYRLEWAEVPTGLGMGIAQSDAVILEAQANDVWRFRLRFDDNRKLSMFHNYIVEHELPIRIERTYTLTEKIGNRSQFNLTQGQREALVLALQRGYFDSPRKVTLATLAEELDISKQALSQRVRRATEKVLRESMSTMVARD